MTSTTLRRLWRGLQALALALCALSLGPGPSPVSAGGSPFSSFTASSTSLPLGGSATLTATVTYDVGPTPYYIDIFDMTTGALLRSCGTGTTCSVSVTHSTPTFRPYKAYVTLPTTTPPTSFQGVAEVDVSWSAIAVSLSASSSGPFVLTAVAAKDVGPTPYYIEIFNLTTGAPVGQPCGTGTTCSGTAVLSGGNPQTFQAFVANHATAPPTSFQGASNYVITGGKG